jgi:hypothetical protein
MRTKMPRSIFECPEFVMKLDPFQHDCDEIMNVKNGLFGLG